MMISILEHSPEAKAICIENARERALIDDKPLLIFAAREPGVNAGPITAARPRAVNGPQVEALLFPQPLLLLRLPITVFAFHPLRSFAHHCRQTRFLEGADLVDAADGI
jgi:hypothetical protein